MKKIILTGGGTAGHVTPNIALLPELKAKGYDIKYIGTYDGMEKGLIENTGIPYFGISSGKLRRYFSLQNFTDPFRVIKGYFEAKRIIKREAPDVLFSKGGFVSVPVVRAAKKNHIPVIIHESDMTPGLANKLCYSSASRICCNFPETLDYLPKDKAVLTGSPIRKELLSGDRLAGLRFTGLSGKKPVLLIIGGSLGSKHVNDCVRRILPQLLKDFDVIHLCGKGNIDESLKGTPGYVQYEYVGPELKDCFALCDVVISRAGANSICELLALKKPNLLIPLPLSASRGDQILNANSFKKQGFSMVMEEEELTDEKLIDAVNTLYKERDKYIKTMENSSSSDAISIISKLIEEVQGNN
ncbi:MAG: undecaprenyldiphospho-muramoylpentapeptide beta-N-acetylglucosaminyltransferase [Lachnospiraceae bacterium]|nr:undecaprenyldiphospho-muramoylpentapeptide beta-N-acetylglucosaminyltransferase [Lachnospiraceae bacterium]